MNLEIALRVVNTILSCLLCLLSAYQGYKRQNLADGAVTIGTAYLTIIYGTLAYLSIVGHDDSHLRPWFRFSMTIVLASLVSKLLIELQVERAVRRKLTRWKLEHS